MNCTPPFQASFIENMFLDIFALFPMPHSAIIDASEVGNP